MLLLLVCLCDTVERFLDPLTKVSLQEPFSTSLWFYTASESHLVRVLTHATEEPLACSQLERAAVCVNCRLARRCLCLAHKQDFLLAA